MNQATGSTYLKDVDWTARSAYLWAYTTCIHYTGTTLSPVIWRQINSSTLLHLFPSNQPNVFIADPCKKVFLKKECFDTFLLRTIAGTATDVQNHFENLSDFGSNANMVPPTAKRRKAEARSVCWQQLWLNNVRLSECENVFVCARGCTSMNVRVWVNVDNKEWGELVCSKLVKEYPSDWNTV